MKRVLILGIESSCDETAAAVVADGERILSNVVASQVLTHEKFGGVVPEIASREHLKKIGLVVEEALARAAVDLHGIDALAVTEGPGLIGSLLVGVVYGKGLAFSLGKPLVGVNHLEGHIHAVLLENKRQHAAGATPEAATFPAVALVVSGGHTSLFLVREMKDGSARFQYVVLGQTRDDAAGEAFDKVAKLLALGYPGGPVIDRLARFGRADAVDFGRIKMRGNPLDFSFSGLKTAVLYRVRGSHLAEEAEKRRAWRKGAGDRVTADDVRVHCSDATLDLIASFQNAVVTDLVERTIQAAEAHAVPTILVTGGVACNSLLRARFAEAARARALQAFFPSLELSTDNAAMIAAAGYFRLAAGERAGITLTAHATFPLG
jgi:N6-L-threonylcarbamoyladenine synthase